MSPDAAYVVDGLRTHVRVRGEGPALLLIGGIWSQVSLWDDVLSHLEGFATIAFDPPGIGATDLPRCPYTIRQHTRFAAGVLDAVGIPPAHVLGVSLGGAVAQHFARSYPDRVDGLVLVSTTFGAPSLPGRPGALIRFARPRAYGNLNDLERNAGRIFGGRMRQEPELVHHWHLRPPNGLRAYLYRLAGAVGWSSLPWLHRLTAPTLVVHGDDDPIVPLMNARVLARRVPDARLHVAKGAGHLLMLDSAVEVLPVIKAFLDATDHRLVS